MARAASSTAGAPGQLGQQARELDRGLRAARLLEHVAEPRAVVLGDAPARLGERRVRQRERGQHLAREPEVAEIDRRPRQPDRGQRLDAERDRLGVALGAGDARQLDARLRSARAGRAPPRSRRTTVPS